MSGARNPRFAPAIGGDRRGRSDAVIAIQDATNPETDFALSELRNTAIRIDAALLRSTNVRIRKR